LGKLLLLCCIWLRSMRVSTQGWREGPISFQPTYKYHLGCNVYSGEPLPPGIAMVRAVDSSNSLADSASDTTEGEQ
jgi:hypothetical protein